VAVVQQRTPPLPGRRARQCGALAAAALDAGLFAPSRIVVLGAADAGARGRGLPEGVF
jgi:hypothetical protein